LAVSSDERYIAFVSRRTGRDQIWRVDADGGHLTQLTNVDFNVALPAFGADSKKVYFLGWTNGALRLYEVPLEGGDATLVLDDEIYHDWSPSPDGKHIAYLTFDRDARRRRIHIYSFATKQTEQIVDVVSDTFLGWSEDGRSLFFTSASDATRNVWQISLDGGKQEQVTDFADERVFRFAVSPRTGMLATIRETTTYDAVMLTADAREP
jgi:Tol biopolymer transport system component